jgi:hypothetical protein
MIYHIRGEHANHYATNAVQIDLIDSKANNIQTQLSKTGLCNMILILHTVVP